MTTAILGTRIGYSTQQVRDLERLGVIPPAERAPNGYRRYAERHEVALHAYRALAAAIGPVPARQLMPELRSGSIADAAARIDDMHADLAAERARVKEALRGLASAMDEAGDVFESSDVMAIGQLASALGVRASAIRHWEREGLINPTRQGAAEARSFGATAITEARIVAALRAGGYGIPLIKRILGQVRQHRITAEAERVLIARLDALARRSVALLAASGSIHDLLSTIEPASENDPATIASGSSDTALAP